MRSVKGIIIGFLLILLGFAAAQYSLVAAGILAAGGLAVVVVSALPKKIEKAAAGTTRCACACQAGSFFPGAAAGYSDRPACAAGTARAAPAGGGSAL